MTGNKDEAWCITDDLILKKVMMMIKPDSIYCVPEQFKTGYSPSSIWPVVRH